MSLVQTVPSTVPVTTTPDAPATTGSATTQPPSDSGLGHIVVRPNSGHTPYYSGDRGTWPQYAVMGGIILALIVIVLLVRRQAAAGRERLRTRKDPSTSSSTNSPDSNARQ